jgi:hypothetical protein
MLLANGQQEQRNHGLQESSSSQCGRPLKRRPQCATSHGKRNQNQGRQSRTADHDGGRGQVAYHDRRQGIHSTPRRTEQD